MKLASEEARAHPTRATNLQSSMSDVNIVNQRSQYYVHDKKLTFCLEAYIQWFNRLTFFITTEIVKHTQRRSRVRLINYFIDTAYECFRLHNFNSMIGILGKKNFLRSLCLSSPRERTSSARERPRTRVDPWIEMDPFSCFTLIIVPGLVCRGRARHMSSSLRIHTIINLMNDTMTTTQEISSSAGTLLRLTWSSQFNQG